MHLNGKNTLKLQSSELTFSNNIVGHLIIIPKRII